MYVRAAYSVCLACPDDVPLDIILHLLMTGPPLPL